MRPKFPLVACSSACLLVGIVIGSNLVDDRPAPARAHATELLAPQRATPPVDKPSTGVSARVENFLRTEWADTVELINACGDVSAFTDREASDAWDLLLSRRFEGTHQEKSLSVYLWSRMVRLQPGLPFPERWTVGVDLDALVAEETRQSMDRIAQRLRAGEPLSDIVRRAFFKELIKKDARAALEFWFEVSKPLDEIRDLPLFSQLLSDPTQRDATLARLRAWPAEQQYVDELIVAVAGPWLIGDLKGSEAWIRSLPESPLKERLLTQFGAAHGVGNPHETFRWSENLPVEQRMSARSMSVIQLAERDPASGMLLINSVKDAGEREALTRTFASTLAFTDVDSWIQWRDALPPADRNLANSAGFPAWADREAEKASAWLATQAPGRERDVLAAELVRITAAKNTPTAIAWINSIQDPRHRMTAISAALNNLEPGDTARMETILNAVAKNKPPASPTPRS
jgi:hypothetical protein